MRSHRFATLDTDFWGRAGDLLFAAVMGLIMATFTYAVLFAVFIFAAMTTQGEDRVAVPPPPAGLALPPLPKPVSVAILLGPCALAGGVVMGPARWWAGIAGGIGLGVLSGAVLYLSNERSLPDNPVLALVNWVLAGYLGAIVGQCWRELGGGSSSRAACGEAEPTAAPDPAR